MSDKLFGKKKAQAGYNPKRKLCIVSSSKASNVRCNFAVGLQGLAIKSWAYGILQVQRGVQGEGIPNLPYGFLCKTARFFKKLFLLPNWSSSSWTRPLRKP